MSKKRNLAVLMAAATVATSVAPVFAAEVKDVDEATLISEVGKLLGTRYTDPDETGIIGETADEAYQNSVYKIEATIDGVTSTVESVQDLRTKIEKAKVDGEDLDVKVTDKGHATVDGKIVSKVSTVNRYVDNAKLLEIETELAKDENKPLVKSIAKIGLDGEETQGSEYEAIKVELVGGKTIEIKQGDKVLDFKKGLDANGNKIDLNDLTGLQSSVLKNVTGFEIFEAEDGKATTQELPSFTSAKYTLGSNVVIEKNVSDYYTIEGGYTEAGANLANKLIDAKTAPADVVINGVKYQIANVNDNTNIIKATKDGYELTISMKYVKDGDDFTEVAENNLKLVIKSDKQEDLAQIKKSIAATTDVVAGRITYLSGDDRFATAVGISKDAYAAKDTTPKSDQKNADAIVLVGENAIVDGLASAPLAHKSNAPVLLTKANEVPAETMNEIKRLVDKGTDIYLIGGTSTISKDVEAQLIKEMNASIKRVSGDDRFATSSAIAEELGGTPTKAFVVGGDGLADAMSIASVAAKQNAPILVTPADKLGKDAKSTLKDLKSGLTDGVTVVGGESKVSTQVIKDIQEDEKIKITANRLSGETRADTNAAVINEYFANAKNASGDPAPVKAANVFVAKDGYTGGDGQLIDALAVAPTVAQRNGMLVLASDKLSSEQDKKVKDSVVKDANNNKLYQVGQGVGADVLTSLLSKLGL